MNKSIKEGGSRAIAGRRITAFPHRDLTDGTRLIGADDSNNTVLVRNVNQRIKDAREIAEQAATSAAAAQAAAASSAEDAAAAEAGISEADADAKYRQLSIQITSEDITSLDGAKIQPASIPQSALDFDISTGGGGGGSGISQAFADGRYRQIAVTIDTGDLENNAVTHSKLADDAVGERHLQDDAIQSAHIQTAQIINRHLADEAIIETVHIEDDAVTTAKINDGAVTAGKIAAGSVGVGKIADGFVISADWIADRTLVERMYGVDSIPSTAYKVGSVSSLTLADGSVVRAKIADNAVFTPQLNDLGVTTPKIGNRAVTREKIADTAIDADKIENETITYDKLSPTAVNRIIDPVRWSPDVVSAIGWSFQRELGDDIAGLNTVYYEARTWQAQTIAACGWDKTLVVENVLPGGDSFTVSQGMRVNNDGSIEVLDATNGFRLDITTGLGANRRIRISGQFEGGGESGGFINLSNIAETNVNNAIRFTNTGFLTAGTAGVADSGSFELHGICHGTDDRIDFTISINGAVQSETISVNSALNALRIVFFPDNSDSANGAKLSRVQIRTGTQSQVADLPANTNTGYTTVETTRNIFVADWESTVLAAVGFDFQDTITNNVPSGGNVRNELGVTRNEDGRLQWLSTDTMQYLEYREDGLAVGESYQILMKALSGADVTYPALISFRNSQTGTDGRYATWRRHGHFLELWVNGVIDGNHQIYVADWEQELLFSFAVHRTAADTLHLYAAVTAEDGHLIGSVETAITGSDELGSKGLYAGITGDAYIQIGGNNANLNESWDGQIWDIVIDKQVSGEPEINDLRQSQYYTIIPGLQDVGNVGIEVGGSIVYDGEGKLYKGVSGLEVGQAMVFMGRARLNSTTGNHILFSMESANIGEHSAIRAPGIYFHNEQLRLFPGHNSGSFTSDDFPSLGDISPTDGFYLYAFQIYRSGWFSYELSAMIKDEGTGVAITNSLTTTDSVAGDMKDDVILNFGGESRSDNDSEWNGNVGDVIVVRRNLKIEDITQLSPDTFFAGDLQEQYKLSVAPVSEAVYLMYGANNLRTIMEPGVAPSSSPGFGDRRYRFQAIAWGDLISSKGERQLWQFKDNIEFSFLGFDYPEPSGNSNRFMDSKQFFRPNSNGFYDIRIEGVVLEDSANQDEINVRLFLYKLREGRTPEWIAEANGPSAGSIRTYITQDSVYFNEDGDVHIDGHDNISAPFSVEIKDVFLDKNSWYLAPTQWRRGSGNYQDYLSYGDVIGFKITVTKR